jgi:sulfur carrier protein
MQIIVNGIEKEFDSEIISVSDFLELESLIKTDGIAIAINQNVIPKSEWKKTLLKKNDQLLIIKATQGG